MEPPDHDHKPLRPGDLVEVRPAAEILATLHDGAVDSVPFMPEMLPFVGKRFRVAQRAEKICDLVGPGGSRRMRNAVFLENLRCDGSSHGGCQAECRFTGRNPGCAAWRRRGSHRPARRPTTRPERSQKQRS